MKITYLPEVSSPTSSTVFPISTAGVSKKVQLNTLNSFSGAGTVGAVFAGQNMKLAPSPALTVSSISFSFPGAIFPFPSDTIPTGWLFCNGQAVSRQTYSSLFSVIGVSYGSGDNRSTFNLPDLRGRAIAGLETMGGVSTSGRLSNTRLGNINGTVLGSTGGEEVHTLTSQETGLKSHTHTHDLSISWGGDNEDGNKCVGDFAQVPGQYPFDTFSLTWNYSFTNNAASDSSATSHPNLPPLVFLNYIIKY